MATRQDKLKELATAEPNLESLREDYDWCVRRRDDSLFGQRAKLNYDTRYCVWPGQSPDGRKWAVKGNEKEVWPWPGASDARVHLVDNYISEDAAMLMVLWRRNKIICTPTESNDARSATHLTQLLRWLVYTQMKELQDEARLASQIFLERGSFVLNPVWMRELRLGYDEVDVETLQQRATQAGLMLQLQARVGQMPGDWTEEQASGAVELYQGILDPAREQRLVDLFLQYYPDVRRERALKAIRDLRETGHARFVRPYTFKNCPGVWTLAPNEDVFLPEDAPRIADASGIHYRELLTEAALRERKRRTDQDESGYDPAWIDEVIETQRGVITTEFQNKTNLRVRRQAGTGNSGRTNTERLYEIIHSYRKLADTEGVLGIYYTCWHAGLTTASSRRQNEFAWAYHGLLNYDHGEYPFELVQRERRDRILGNARGYGEIASTWQNQIKSEWDQRIDRSSLKTNPPMRHPPAKPPEQWGPGAKLPAREGDYGFIEGPRGEATDSRTVTEDIRNHSNQYFGRKLGSGENAVGSEAIRQDLGDVWMAGWGRAYTQVLQLEQQFGPDEIFYRVIGTDKARPLRVSRAEIQGQFDVSVSFNTRLFDPEYVEVVFGFIDRALQWDVGGRVDRDEIVQFGFDVLDPNLGERVMKPAQEASAAEIEDERTVVAKMASGVATDVKPGQAWQLRAQTLEQTIRSSPKLMEQMKTDPQFREMVLERMKKLQFQVQQYTVNAETGRQGGKPAMAGGY